MDPIHTTKATVAADGKTWISVPVILIRSGSGWIERYPAPSDRAGERKAA